MILIYMCLEGEAKRFCHNILTTRNINSQGTILRMAGEALRRKALADWKVEGDPLELQGKDLAVRWYSQKCKCFSPQT